MERDIFYSYRNALTVKHSRYCRSKLDLGIIYMYIGVLPTSTELNLFGRVYAVIYRATMNRLCNMGNRSRCKTRLRKVIIDVSVIYETLYRYVML